MYRDLLAAPEDHDVEGVHEEDDLLALRLLEDEVAQRLAKSDNCH